MDNGSAFVDAALKRAAARLGIKITHSAPGRPQGQGEDRAILPDCPGGVPGRDRRRVVGIADLAELNRLFTAWCETVYHARPHGETGQPPMDRWLAGAPFPVPEPAQLREAFLWSENRLVRKDATIRLFGGAYETDPVLAGRKVECVFDPFDLTVLEIRWNGSPYGTAVPRKITPALPPQGETRAAGRSRRPRPGSTTWPSSPPSTLKPPAGIASATTPSLTATARPGQEQAGSERAAAAGRAGQRRARLGRPARRAGPAASATIETAAYLTAKAAVLERIAAEREQGGWTPEDITAAAEAAARARETADAAALLAAAGITTMED